MRRERGLDRVVSGVTFVRELPRRIGSLWEGWRQWFWSE